MMPTTAATIMVEIDERLSLYELHQLHVRTEEIFVSISKARDFVILAPEGFYDALASRISARFAVRSAIRCCARCVLAEIKR